MIGIDCAAFERQKKTLLWTCFIVKNESVVILNEIFSNSRHFRKEFGLWFGRSQECLMLLHFEAEKWANRIVLSFILERAFYTNFYLYFDLEIIWKHKVPGYFIYQNTPLLREIRKECYSVTNRYGGVRKESRKSHIL